MFHFTYEMNDMANNELNEIIVAIMKIPIWA